MSFFQDKEREFKYGIIFASIAAILVLLLGIFSGRSFGKILITLLLSGVIFFGLGFGITTILLKLTPEIFGSNVGANIDAIVGEDEGDTEEVDYNSDFEESIKENLENNFLVDKGKPKEKKHVMKVGGEEFEYDPKIAAEAIRSKLKEDED
mgnify:CR=1 FL=1